MQVSVLPFLSLVSLVCLTQESPRLLLAHRKYEQAFLQIDKGIRMNRGQTPLLEHEKTQMINWVDQNMGRYNDSFYVFRRDQLGRTLLMDLDIVIGVVVMSVLFSLFPAMVIKEQNRLVLTQSFLPQQQLYTMLMAYPSFLLLLLVYCVVDSRIFGRKEIMLLLKVVSAICLLLSIYVEQYTVYFYLAVMVSNYLIVQFVPIVASEVYPTGLRASGVNGIMIAGMLAEAVNIFGWLDIAVQWMVEVLAPLAQLLLVVQVVSMGIQICMPRDRAKVHLKED